VLVIGAGTSAVEIACDAARAGAVTFLSIRHGRRIRPKHLRGVPTDALLAGLLDAGPAVGSPYDLLAAATGDMTAVGLPRPDPSAHAGHPVMTDDLLPLLAEGRIRVRSDVAEIDAAGVRFVDGAAEQVDLIIAATGFDRRIPFVDAKTYARNGSPDLYLNIFSRSHDGLAVLGLIDLAGPTFPSYDDQARVVMVDVTVRELGGAEQRAWRAGMAAQPDLRGGTRFADTPARAFTVHDNAYSTRLRDLCDRFGYPPGGSWGDGPSGAPEPPPAPGLGTALRATLR
jgi:cation diffusion facilitator CzcD-associated flavoprotein CzcO